MSTANVSKRYAEALFQIGKEKSSLEQLEVQLQTVKEVFESNKQLMNVLGHPRVENEKKKALIKSAFQDFHADIIHLISLLVDRHNQGLIPAIADHFTSFVNEENGIAQANVYSVRELSDEEKQQLSDVFSKKLNLKKLKMDNIVDPSLIGGVRLKIGNTIYDGSIKGKLERIERNIVSAN